MRIFIAGGTGFVGEHVQAALLRSGHQLRLLTHTRKSAAEAGVEQVVGDVTILDSFAAGVAGCEATINLVGIIREFPGRGVTFERMHEQATRNIIEAAHRAGVKRHLQMSALGTRPAAISAYHRSKFQGEEVVRRSGLDWTIFRPSIIFGPKDGFVNLLAGYIKQFPVVPVIGNGRYRLQPISADDVARCFSNSLTMPQTVGETYELCGKDRFSYIELLDTIGRVLGKRHVAKVFSPLGVMRVVVPLLQAFPFFPITMDQIQMLVEENICEGSWQGTFGFEPEGFEATIRRYLQ